MIQVISLSCSLSDSGEHGVPTVSLSDIVNQLLNKHGLADSGTSEESNFTTSSVRGQQIDHFNTGDQQFSS
jgi:hypothetical protein